MEIHARENLNPLHNVEGKSYQGTTQRGTVKGLLSRIYITVLCVAKSLYPGTIQRNP